MTLPDGRIRYCCARCVKNFDMCLYQMCSYCSNEPDDPEKIIKMEFVSRGCLLFCNGPCMREFFETRLKNPSINNNYDPICHQLGEPSAVQNCAQQNSNSLIQQPPLWSSIEDNVPYALQKGTRDVPHRSLVNSLGLVNRRILNKLTGKRINV